jgi:hypothetical protein
MLEVVRSAGTSVASLSDSQESLKWLGMCSFYIYACVYDTFLGQFSWYLVICKELSPSHGLNNVYA